MKEVRDTSKRKNRKNHKRDYVPARTSEKITLVVALISAVLGLIRELIGLVRDILD